MFEVIIVLSNQKMVSRLAAGRDANMILWIMRHTEGAGQSVTIDLKKCVDKKAVDSVEQNENKRNYFFALDSYRVTALLVTLRNIHQVAHVGRKGCVFWCRQCLGP